MILNVFNEDLVATESFQETFRRLKKKVLVVLWSLRRIQESLEGVRSMRRLKWFLRDK